MCAQNKPYRKCISFYFISFLKNKPDAEFNKISKIKIKYFIIVDLVPSEQITVFSLYSRYILNDEWHYKNLYFSISFSMSVILSTPFNHCWTFKVSSLIATQVKIF